MKSALRSLPQPAYMTPPDTNILSDAEGSSNHTNHEGTTHESDVADLLLCPSYAYGFSLETKEWCKFLVEFLHPFEWKSNAMSALILPDAQRKLI